MIGQHQELCRRKRLALYFSLIGCITFRVALSRGFLHHVSCRVSCRVASSLALALPAVALALPAVLQQQQLVTSPHAAYHPRASSCFFSLATFSLFSLANSTKATHSLRQSGCNLSRREENCCANSIPHHSTKQCNKHHVAIEAQVKTLEAQ